MNLRYFIWLSAAVTLLLRNLLLLDGSSFVVGVPTGSFWSGRCELVDGLRIMVMTNRSSGGGESATCRLERETLRKEERLVLGLLVAASDDVDEAGEGVDRSSLFVTDLADAESGERRWMVDCARCRGGE